MPYPIATAEQIDFFEDHGWIAVEGAIDPSDLGELEEKCNHIIAN